MNITFLLRKRGKAKPVIFLQVCDARFKGRRFWHSTGYSIVAEHWNTRGHRAKLNTARGHEYERLNQDLDRLEQLVIQYRSNKQSAPALDKAELKAHILTNGVESPNERETSKQSELFSIWLQIIDSAKNSSGETIGPRTRLSKLQTFKLVQKFATRKAIQLTLEDIDMPFYYEFDAFMIEHGLNGNSRGKHFKEIKAVMREAVDRDYKVNLAFQKKSFKVIRTEPDSIFLNDDEIKILLNLKLAPHLERLRDIFVMACFVGARHSDWHQINEQNIFVEKGKQILKIRQQKTNDITHVPVHPVVRMILNKYEGNPPKVISNQKCNKAIQKFCKDADFGKTTVNNSVVEKWTLVSTHTARRSFATNAYLSRSMDVHQIMKCTGHKTESSFLRYLKLNGKDFAIQAADSSFFTNNSYTMGIAS